MMLIWSFGDNSSIIRYYLLKKTSLWNLGYNLPRFAFYWSHIRIRVLLLPCRLRFLWEEQSKRKQGKNAGLHLKVPQLTTVRKYTRAFTTQWCAALSSSNQNDRNYFWSFEFQCLLYFFDSWGWYRFGCGVGRYSNTGLTVFRQDPNQDPSNWDSACEGMIYSRYI